MKLSIFAVALLLAGCASTSKDNFYWYKPSASQSEFNMDTGQCRAQAFSVSGGNLLQVVLVYDGCMHGKGWQKMPV